MLLVEQGWSEQPLLTITGILIGGALIIAAIRWMFGKK
jgi:hypothetical protein